MVYLQLAEFCTDPNFLKVILLIKKVLNVLCFIIPIILIIMVSVDFSKSVISQSEDDMKKNASIAFKRILYCATIFLVPTIVNTAFGLLGEAKIDYVSCYNNADSEKLQNIIIENIENAIDKLEKEPTRDNLSAAESALMFLTNEELRKKFSDIIEEFRVIIKDKEQQEQQKDEENKNDDNNNNSNNNGNNNNTGNNNDNNNNTGNNNGSGNIATSAGKGLWVAHMKNSASKVNDAINEGFWGIEVDVYQSGNIFQLYHDPKNDPYNGYNLDVFLDTCKANNITAVLDIKSVNDFSKLIGLVKSKNMQNNTIYQTSVGNAKNIYNVDNNARIWVLIGDANKDIVGNILKQIKEVKKYVEGVNMLALNVDSNDISIVRSFGLTFCSFSYNSVLYSNANADTLRKWGSNYIMANNIDEN